MSTHERGRWLGLLGIVAIAATQSGKTASGSAVPAQVSGATLHWFQTTEQELVDSIARGDKEIWNRVMDPSCVVTSEEGSVTNKKQFLDELRPLPPGLSGGITVQELTVQEFPTFAVVRYLADEWEAVFGQRLATKYRMTDTFRRDGQDWKMVASHCAVVTQDPPAQSVSRAEWPGFVGKYRLMPDGWTLTVELREGNLYGGRDPAKLRPFVALAPSAFVLSGSLGEWIFVSENGKAVRILDFRKFEPLVWTRGP